MVLLSAIKQLLHPEQPFEKGHPVQLLLYLFNQFNQESVLLLLNQVDIILPAIPKQAQELTQRAEKLFDEAFETHQCYQNATAQQKERIEQEIKKKRSEIRAQSDDTKQTELDDENQLHSHDMNNKEQWMDAKQFRLCDLYFRKALKLAPNSIKCCLKHLKFLMQNNQISLAEDVFHKTLSIIHNLKSKSTKTKTKTSTNITELNLNIMDLNKIENLVTFYYAYLYYMNDDIKSFDSMLTKCLEQEPDNIGMRSQYIVCLTTAHKYEEAYQYLIETLKLLKHKETQYIKDTMEDKATAFKRMDMIRHYRVVLGIGCAAIRCVVGVDWNMVTEHLQFVVDNDDSNIGVIGYCLSYSMYKEGRYDESNDLYNEFTAYIHNKRVDAEKRKLERRRNREIDERTEQELKEEAMKDAAAELTMDFFKWHPNNHKDNTSEMIDLMLDVMVISMLILATYYIAGYTPHFGNGIMDWFVIGIALIVSCVLVTPSLGILLMAVTLPPYNYGDFNYFTFATRWLCVSAGLLFVYRMVSGQYIPVRKLF